MIKIGWLNLGWWLIVSWVYFVLSDGTPDKKLALVIFLAAEIMGKAVERMPKKIIIPVLGLSIYGFLVNQYDMRKRPMYWLDNRPIVYGKFFEWVKKYENKKYQKIFVSNLMGSAEKYGAYYLGKKDNVIYESFDLTKNQPKKDSFYLGLVGEFLGKRADDQFLDELTINGVEVLEKFKLNDKIAFGFGEMLLAVESYE